MVRFNWTDESIALLGTLSDKKVGLQLGAPRMVVTRARKRYRTIRLQ